ncbi:MAG: hypothetical protein J6A26_06825, partial [Oscillospiraceae bacterium]|nr:hypothetical protein [Oscillospiraceae bacterium]
VPQASLCLPVPIPLHFFFLFACTLGNMVIYYMQPSRLNSLIFTGAVLVLRQLFEYFFYYVMWGYEDISLILLRHMIPNIILTLVVTPPMYWFVQRIHQIWRRKLND